ncbi:MAG: protein-L-isoaspartate(D-aspartate) O-methyltransferase [FCB group bacterium]|nr:protein-L-isoaspartate(D-aspartate) O-methyltransferase [FCB group bacterium]MBL7028305.1 protein-L-isoaspartate(D-aspartate) O-methyltransferase [Candidatus Neomarinimicrobiota bacterium]MBL7121624.1 protein-L-isoaspartate(D-aspartate) O-methyltransferase [Candidatus Neomarinimicrobiota bacterium]
MSKTKTSLFLICLFTLAISVLAWGVLKGELEQNISGSDFQNQRREMVEKQIKKRGIKDRLILDTFLRVPRHRFVPDEIKSLAYSDRALPIGEEQTISQPYIVAFMTKALNLSPQDKILEIGTGSGYQAAILGELCDSVFTIEIIASLGNRAKLLLEELGYDNIIVKIGDGYQGWEEYAPFDAIIVTCAPTQVPTILKDQLKEGGRMIIPVGSSYRQDLVLLRKANHQLVEEKVLPVIFVPMVDTTGKKY